MMLLEPGCSTVVPVVHVLLVSKRDFCLKALLASALANVPHVLTNYSELTDRSAPPSEEIDLTVMDLTLPNWEMIAACRYLWDTGIRAPILMVNIATGSMRRMPASATIQEQDCGDLVTQVRKLVANSSQVNPHHMRDFSFGEVSVDFTTRTVTRGGVPINLSPKEFELLRYLILWRGSVISRSELLSAVWRYRADYTRTLDVHISMLRQKLETSPRKPSHIFTVRGEGYLFLNEALEIQPQGHEALSG
jgi:two-component system, OmpR family, alkaline phosphatase synthesis response regulator PhoP